MRRQRNVTQMKEQIKTPEKLKKMGISNLSEVEFKILVIRMLRELSEDLNCIKKIQSERKDTLIKIKNNLQGNNNRVNEAENQINDLEHKEAKTSQSEQREEKRIPKNEDDVISLWDKLKRFQHSHHRGARRRRERARNWKSI